MGIDRIRSCSGTLVLSTHHRARPALWFSRWLGVLMGLAACSREAGRGDAAETTAVSPLAPTQAALSKPALDIPYAAPTLGDAIEKTFANLQVTPNNDAALAYRLGVPGQWSGPQRLDPVAAKPLAPQGLGSFAGSVQPGSPATAVTVTRFPFELPVDAWVRHSLAQQGYTLVAGRYFPGPHSIFYDATATRGSGDAEEVLRTSAHADGGRVFSVNTTSARRHWDAAKETFWVAHVSFELLNGTGSSQLEPWKEVYTKDPAFGVGYPSSWSAEAVKSSRSGVSEVELRLLDGAGKVVLGYVQVRALRDSEQSKQLPLARLRDENIARLRKSFSYVPSRPFVALTEQDDPRGEAVNGWLGGFAGEEKVSENGSETDVAVRLGFLRRGGNTFCLSALSAPVRDDTLAAFRTQRAFEIARDSLGVPHKP